MALEQINAEQLAAEGGFNASHKGTIPLVKFSPNAAPMPAPVMVPHHARYMQVHPVQFFQQHLHGSSFAIAIPAPGRLKSGKCRG
jgi:hypothetical protein